MFVQYINYVEQIYAQISFKLPVFTEKNINIIDVLNKNMHRYFLNSVMVFCKTREFKRHLRIFFCSIYHADFLFFPARQTLRVNRE